MNRKYKSELENMYPKPDYYLLKTTSQRYFNFELYRNILYLIFGLYVTVFFYKKNRILFSCWKVHFMY